MTYTHGLVFSRVSNYIAISTNCNAVDNNYNYYNCVQIPLVVSQLCPRVLNRLKRG